MSNTLHELLDLVSSKPVLSRKDLQRVFGKCLATIDRWHRNGTLPPGRYLPGCRAPFWSASIILAHTRRRGAAKKSAPKPGASPSPRR